MNGQQIVELVGAVCGSTAGAGVISFCAFLIKDAIVNKIQSKKSKLLASDKKEIAEEVKAAIRDGVELDITNELDKATKKLISEQKDRENKLIKQNNELRKLVVAMADVLANLKSLQGTQVIAKLRDTIDKEPIEEVETVDNGRVVANVKLEEKKEEKVEEKKLDLKY